MTRKHDIPAWRQLHLVRLALRHPKTTKADVAVLAEIVQRYHRDYGNGWASHEMLSDEAGVHKRSVIRAKSKLEKLGFIYVLEEGRRGRATVYLPNFEMVDGKGDKSDTKTNGDTVVTETALIGDTAVTECAEYGDTAVTPSFLQLPVYQTGILERSNDPDAPLAVGLPATAASAGEKKFDELYKAYGYRRNRADAKAAYQAIAPDDDLHADIVESANAWRSSWAAQNKPDAPRYTLAKWLERECYLEDAPTGFVKREPKQKASQNSKRKKMNTVSNNESRLLVVQSADIKFDGEDSWLVMTLIAEDGYTEDFDMLIDAGNSTRSEEAHRNIAGLVKACGLVGINDCSELVGKSFLMDDDGEFSRAPHAEKQDG